MSDPSFYWFDYETFGTHPAWDRPCQFAGIRTDLDLNEIDDPLMLYCRQPMDYLPHPEACKITGISPILANRQGFRECKFIERIVKEIGKPETCSLGYNSIRFDDEFTRHTLFRNFFDPYEHEYREGASRWDLLDIVRLTRALRPDGINWPTKENGAPSNKLEHLSLANGITHIDAHDALSDVRATIELARLIKSKQPKLFHFAFDNRDKHAVAKQLNVADPQISLFVSGLVPAKRSHIAPILPLALHPSNRNSVIVLDLENDPSPLTSFDDDQLYQAFFSAKSDLPEGQSSRQPRLRTLQINKCPVVVPYSALLNKDAERLGLSKLNIERHAKTAKTLVMNKEMLGRIKQAIGRQSWSDGHSDVDGSLYSGSFMSPADKERAALLRASAPENMQDISANFEDKRFVELAWRYQARNFPESLSKEEQQRWREHCHARLSDGSAPWLGFETFKQQMERNEWQESDMQLKDDLEAHLSSVSMHASAELTDSGVQRLSASVETQTEDALNKIAPTT